MKFEKLTDEARQSFEEDGFLVVRNALDREKELKGWRREKKLWLMPGSIQGGKTWPQRGMKHKVPWTTLGMTRNESSEKFPEDDVALPGNKVI